MRRAGIKRGTKRLQRHAELKPGKSQLARTTPLRHRSKKQEAKYRIRRPLVEQLLSERPACERCDSARSTEVHEPRLRSRGADINDPKQCVCLCSPCHQWVHANPAAATDAGWMVPSWKR